MRRRIWCAIVVATLSAEIWAIPSARADPEGCQDNPSGCASHSLQDSIQAAQQQLAAAEAQLYRSEPACARSVTPTPQVQPRVPSTPFIADDLSRGTQDAEAGPTGAVPSIASALIQVVQCVKPTSASGTTTGALTLDRVMVQPVDPINAAPMAATASDSPPTAPGAAVFDKVKPTPVGSAPINAKIGEQNDGSNVVATAYLYESTETDRRGRILVAWVGTQVSIFDKTNLYSARSFSQQNGGDSVIFTGSSSPLNSQTTESGGGYDVTLSISGQYGQPNGGFGGSFTAGVTKRYGQEYSTIDGRNYLDANNNVVAHDGGYRSIAHNHHNESRAYAETAAWIFPAGADQSFYVGWFVETKKR